MTAQALIDKLDLVRGGPTKWVARCPAHDDSSPSLSVKELRDGRVLVHCHAGCGALEVLEAVGLDYSELFPPDDEYKSVRGRMSDVPGYWELVIEIYKNDCRAKKPISAKDKALAMEAFKKVKAGITGRNHVYQR